MSTPRTRLRVAFVAGATPDKWARRWREQFPRIPLQLLPVEDALQTAVLETGEADMSLVRLPVDSDVHHVVKLYDEVPVVVVPKDHPATAFDSVQLADLADEQLIQDPREVPGWEQLATAPRLDWPAMGVAEAIEVVASGTGVVVLPMSLARLHHRKDVNHVVLDDGPVTTVALVWRREEDDDVLQCFVGVAKGRTARSSR